MSCSTTQLWADWSSSGYCCGKIIYSSAGKCWSPCLKLAFRRFLHSSWCLYVTASWAIKSPSRRIGTSLQWTRISDDIAGWSMVLGTSIMHRTQPLLTLWCSRLWNSWEDHVNHSAVFLVSDLLPLHCFLFNKIIATLFSEGCFEYIDAFGLALGSDTMVVKQYMGPLVPYCSLVTVSKRYSFCIRLNFWISPKLRK